MRSRRFHDHLTTLVSLGLFAALAAACGAVPESDSEDVENAPEALWVDTDATQGHTISVCWNDTRFPGRWAAIRDAVEDAWGREGRVTFTGWKPCTQQSGTVRINFWNGGGYTSWNSPAIFVNFSEVCDESCDRSSAVHEFGHVLGFKHEQNRTDTPPQYQGGACGTGADNPPGDTSYGPWDICSVMNYCNDTPEASAAGCWAPRLSGWDVEGVRAYYGSKQTGSIVSRNGSRCADVTGASSANGVQIQTWSCGTGSEQRFWLDWAAKRIRRRDDQTKCLAPVGASNMVQQVACDAASSAQTWTFFDTNASGLSPKIRGLGGKCLTRGAQTNQNGGRSMTLSTCNGSTDQVLFYKEDTKQIVDAAGKCLDVPFGNPANGTQIWTWDCIGGAAQEWSYLGDGVFYSGVGKCMDVAGSNTADGTPVQIYDCNGTAAQRWSPHVGMQIRGMGGKCLAMAQATTATNVGAKMMYCADSTTEWWVYSYAAQTIRNQSGLCLQPGAGLGSTANSTQLVATTCTGSSMQRWTINTNGVISHVGSGKCLDVRSGNPDVGTAAQIYDCNGTNAQKWSLSGTITNNNGQCLDVKGMNRDNGAALRTYACVPNAPAEMWDYYF